MNPTKTCVSDPPTKFNAQESLDNILERERLATRDRRNEAAWRGACVPQRHGLVARVMLELDASPWRKAVGELVARAMTGGDWTDVVTGPSGTGKTQAAACLIWSLIYNAPSPKACRYIKLADLLGLFREGLHHEGASESRLMALYSEFEVLVLDEFDKIAGSDYEMRCIQRLLDHRYDGLKKTLLLTNVRRKDLASILPASVISRIQETGRVWEFDWQSFRTADK